MYHGIPRSVVEMFVKICDAIAINSCLNIYSVHKDQISAMCKAYLGDCTVQVAIAIYRYLLYIYIVSMYSYIHV